MVIKTFVFNFQKWSNNEIRNTDQYQDFLNALYQYDEGSYSLYDMQTYYKGVYDCLSQYESLLHSEMVEFNEDFKLAIEVLNFDSRIKLQNDVMEEFSKKPMDYYFCLEYFFHNNKYNKQAISLLRKAVNRFVIRENNSSYDIDALIYGEVDDFLFLTPDEIIDIVLSKKDIYSTAVHFGPLICQPKSRCLNYNPKYEKCRFISQLKWYNLGDDIIENMNNRVISRNN